MINLIHVKYSTINVSTHHRHVKASSPRFNVLIILGCVFVYPAPLLSSISLSGDLIAENTRTRVVPLACEVSQH